VTRQGSLPADPGSFGRHCKAKLVNRPNTPNIRKRPGITCSKMREIKRSIWSASPRRSGLIAKGYRFPDIRRTFARMLYNQGVILTKIQRLLGHKSVLTTERYLGVKFEETREAIMGLDEPLMLACNRTSLISPDVQLSAKPSAVIMLPQKSRPEGRPC